MSISVSKVCDPGVISSLLRVTVPSNSWPGNAVNSSVAFR